MAKNQIYWKQFGLLFLVVLLALTGCRKKEAVLPTAVPTAIVPETLVPQPTPTPVTAQPATTGQTAVDPEAIDWPPQVIFSRPAPGEEALLDGPITIRFDQPMNQASVEGAFDIETVDDAGQAGGEKVTGRFSWPRPDTVQFSPAGSLQRQQRYRVRIGQAAAGLNGFTLDTPLEIYLQTIGEVKVSQVIPADGADGVDTDGAVTVLFNRPIVPLGTTSQASSLPQPLAFDPPVAGTGQWVSTSIFRFKPASPLAGATTYEVSVAEDLTDFTGAALAGGFSWQFTTLQPSVVSIQPENGAVGVAPAGPITITFNMPMDPAKTETAVALGTNRGAVKTDAAWSGNGRVIQLSPREPLSLDTEYQIVVNRSAAAATGEAGLDVQTVSGFSTVPFPSVTRADPTGLANAWQRGLQVEFASPMDWATIDGRIQIDPPPADEPEYFYSEGSTFLSVDFELALNTTYQITIPGDAADPYGNRLGRNFTWQFTTPGYPAVASFNLPGEISQVSTSFPTSVEVIHRNVTEINAALFDLGLPLNLMGAPYQLNDYRPSAAPLNSWSIPLNTAREQVGLETIQLGNGGALPTGVYLITLEAPEVQEAAYWQIQRHMLIVADTNIVVKEMFDGVYVWVTDLASGQPARGYSLTLFSQEGARLGTAVSDTNGFAFFDHTPASSYLSGVIVVSGQPGEAGFGAASSNWDQGVSPWSFGVDIGYKDEPPLFAYLYTDRPIYRPGDTIHYKGLVRASNYGRYSLPEPQTLTLNLETNFYDPGGAGFRDSFLVDLSPDGSFSGEYQVPDDITLGSYQFFLDDENISARRTFTVAEYRKPDFLLGLTPGRAEALRGESVDVVLDASFFFGGPASDLEVNWNIYAEAYQPDFPGPFYFFGDGGQFFYQSPGFFGETGGSFLGDFLTSGSGRTDEDGRLTITLAADLLDNFEPGSQKITVEATVSDISEFPVVGRTSLIYHAAETYVGVIPADPIARAGAESEVDLVTVDWAGEAQANQDVEVVFYQREWQRSRDSQFNLYYTRWEPIDTEIDRVRVTTNGLGKAAASFVPPEGGIFLAVAAVTDTHGRQHTSSATLWAADARFVGGRDDPRERRMELIPDRQEYFPGETAHILVQSPFDGPIQAWLTIERGRLIEQRLVTLQSKSDVLEIPLSPEFAPNVFLSVAAVKPVRVNDTENPYADIRLGITELVVSPSRLALDVRMTPNQEQFEPGDTAVYDILTTDFQGNPVSADVSLALVDLAVLTLKKDNAPAIQEAFYARQPFRSQIGAGLFISGEGLEPEVPLEGGGLGGGGGAGELADTTLSRASGSRDDADVRRDFPDTAFWKASVQTDTDGRATVEIQLPDSLTTWRLSSKAITAHGFVGQAERDVIVTLPLLLQPVTPRFFTVGDQIQIGATVHNNTDSAIEAAVGLEAEMLTIQGQAEQMITLPAHGRVLVRWPVQVLDGEFADLTFRVDGGGFQDAAKPSFGQGPDKLIPIFRYDAPDFSGTSGVVEPDVNRRVEALLFPEEMSLNQGAVDVTLTPSLAAAMIESLEFLEISELQTSCASSLTNQLFSSAAAARAIQILALNEVKLANALNSQIPKMMDALADLSKPDGGWGWCFSEESNEWLTAYTLLALSKSSEAGFAANAQVIDKAADYLTRRLQAPENLTDSAEVNRQAFFLYVLAETAINSGRAASGLAPDLMDGLDGLLAAHRPLLDPYAKGYLALAYELMGEHGGQSQANLLSDLNDSVVLSAAGAHWQDASRDATNLNSDVRGTAVVIDALARIDPSNPLGASAVRWLMTARTAQHWATEHETAWSIFSLTDWMAATGELEAAFGYRLALNTQSFLSGQFSQDNLTASERTSIPLAAMTPGEVNFLDFQRTSGNGRLYYTAFLHGFIDAATVEPLNRGFAVERRYFDAACDPEAETCLPIDTIGAGQMVRVELTLVVPQDRLYVIVEDPIPSGTEAIDPGLETTASLAAGGSGLPEYRAGYWGWWFFNRIEYQDEKVVILSDYLPEGTYQYTYFLQPNIPGVFQVVPASARESFFPDVFGRSAGMKFLITSP